MSTETKATQIQVPPAITLVDAYIELSAAATKHYDGRLAITWANCALEIESSHPEALICRGVGFKAIKDFKAAMRDFERAAESGDPYALFAFALAYVKGEITEKRPKEAFVYAQRSADGRSPNGTALLAQLYLAGIGVEKDENKARGLFEQVARLTEFPHIERVAGPIVRAHALCELGWMCLRGQGGFKADPYAAMDYDRQAAELGQVIGMINYAVSLFKLSQSPADHAIAFQWLLRAHRNNPREYYAIRELIFCYRERRGTGRNELEAKRLERMLWS